MNSACIIAACAAASRTAQQANKKTNDWKSYDNKVIFKYVDELNEELRIDLDPSSLTYKRQFCWEVC